MATTGWVGIACLIGLLLGVGVWWIYYSPWAKRAHARHVEAWRGFTETESGEVSRLQSGCEACIVAAIASRGCEIVGRTKTGTGEETMVTFRVPALGAEVWLHVDQTNVSAPSGDFVVEEWSTETPEEHFAAVSEYFQRLPRLREDA